MQADATIVDGKRLRWQCGCRQNGGTLVQLARPDDPDVDAMKSALRRIAETPGCECDTYHGHKCLMCRVRSIANEGLSSR